MPVAGDQVKIQVFRFRDTIDREKRRAYLGEHQLTRGVLEALTWGSPFLGFSGMDRGSRSLATELAERAFRHSRSASSFPRSTHIIFRLPCLVAVGERRSEDPLLSAACRFAAETQACHLKLGRSVQ